MRFIRAYEPSGTLRVCTEIEQDGDRFAIYVITSDNEKHNVVDLFAHEGQLCVQIMADIRRPLDAVEDGFVLDGTYV